MRNLNLKVFRNNAFFKFVLVLGAFMLLCSNLSADEFDSVNDILNSGSKGFSPFLNFLMVK